MTTPQLAPRDMEGASMFIAFMFVCMWTFWHFMCIGRRETARVLL